MDADLISKKELLQETGISYGQLYRWKRKGLIPEEWFVRKSTFTGQETFFPRDKTLARVKRILALKDEDASLDDIAEAVSPDLTQVSLSAEDASAQGVVSGAALQMYAAVHPDATTLRFGELVAAYVLDRLLGTGEVGLEEGRMVLTAFEDAYPKFEGAEFDLVVLRKMGVASAVFVTSSARVEVDSATRVVARINVQESVEALGARLG